MNSLGIIGIDFGNESSVVAIAKKGVIDIAVNEVSKRKTPSIVSYNDKNRNIGETGKNSYISNIARTVTEIKRFLGLNYEQAIKEKSSSYTISFENFIKKDDFVLLKIGNRHFTPEQVTGAFFNHLKHIAEKTLGCGIFGAVISCPPYFNIKQRKSLLCAAKIANINVLRIMNEITAVSLNYGMYRTLPPKIPNMVIFVDVGDSTTNIGLVSFVKQSLEVMATVSNPTLGGRDFNNLLICYFIKEIKNQYHFDITTNQKAMQRLRNSVKNAKLVLSTNQEANIFIECAINDTDINITINREFFEKMSCPLVKIITDMIENMLNNQKLQMENIHSIELIGGGTRMPIVRSGIERIFGRNASTTCNGDESVSRGCALQSAILSPMFRVREFTIKESVPYSIEACWGAITEDYRSIFCNFEERCTLFSPVNSIPTAKLISFVKTKPFQIVIRYLDKNEHPEGTDMFITRYKITPPPLTKKTILPPKIKVKIALDTNGLVVMRYVFLYEEIELTPEELKEISKKEDKNVKTKDSTSKNNEKDLPKKEEKSKECEMKIDEGDKTTSFNQKKQKKLEETLEKKTKVVKTKLLYEENSNIIDNKILEKAIEVELNMDNNDRIYEQTINIKNELEEYVIGMENKLQNELSLFVDSKVAVQFNQELMKIDEWLYSMEGENSQKSQYKTYLDELRKIGDPIEKRKWEFDNFQGAFNELNKNLIEISNLVKLAKVKDKVYDHLNDEEVNRMIKCTNGIVDWIERIDKNRKNYMLRDPDVTVQDIKGKKTLLMNTCLPILNKPKPKIEKIKEVEKKAEDKNIIEDKMTEKNKENCNNDKGEEMKDDTKTS